MIYFCLDYLIFPWNYDCITVGRWVLDENRCKSSIFAAFGAVVAVQVFLLFSFWACLLGTPTWYSHKIAYLCDLYCKWLVELRSHFKTLPYTEVCEETRVGHKRFEIIGSKPTRQSQISHCGRGWHDVGGSIDPGDHRYRSRVVGTVETREIYELGMGPYPPRVRQKCPSLVGELYSSS